jgi:hypothetical protein
MFVPISPLSVSKLSKSIFRHISRKACDSIYSCCNYATHLILAYHSFPPSCRGAGANPGVEVWRIENKVPVRQPKESYGKFCKGDSYLVLKTTISSGGAYEWDLHFWLGEESSVDEIGIAAYKTVELDDSLGGAPVQYRETQGNESSKFQAVFKQGLTYLDGGVDSGFKKVRTTFSPAKKKKHRLARVSCTT